MNNKKFNIQLMILISLIIFSVDIFADNSSVLFVATGFTSKEENISYDDLTKKYCSNEIYVIESVKLTSDKLFNCENKNIVKNIDDFVTISEKKLIITDIDNLTNRFKTLKVENVSFFDNNEKYKLLIDKNFDYKNVITKLIITGVTAITRQIGTTADKKGTKFITEDLINYFQNADYVHISNEVSFAKKCEFKKGVSFCSKWEHLQILKDLNCNIVELTGNHNLDYGKTPYIETFNFYKENKYLTFGGGLSPEESEKPLIITLKDGKKIGFAGFSQSCPLSECTFDKDKMGATKYSKEKAKEVIEKLKKEVDFIIVSIQYDESSSYTPTSNQKAISKELINMGVDLTYGSQAHQVQQIEFYKNKSIFHGLGNFLFDQVHKKGLRQGYFINLYFYKGKLIQSIPVFTYIDNNRRPVIADKNQKNDIQNAIYDKKLIYKK